MHTFPPALGVEEGAELFDLGDELLDRGIELLDTGQPGLSEGLARGSRFRVANLGTERDSQRFQRGQPALNHIPFDLEVCFPAPGRQLVLD